MRRILLLMIVGWMCLAGTYVQLIAFPVIAATAVSVDTTTDTTQTVSLPASIASGDLLLIAQYGSGTDGVPHTTASGWTVLGEAVVSNAVGHLAVLYKIASGAEGASVNLTTDVAEDSAGCAYRITGWHGTTLPAINVGPPTGASVSPDPAPLTPTWAVEDTTYIVIAGADGSAVDFTAYPTSYDTSQITSPTHTASGGACAMAARDYASISDDPAVFTIDTSVRWVVFTVAVRNIQAPLSAPRRIL